MTEFVEALREVHDSRVPFVVVTLTEVRGSAPQEQGAKMIVTPEGRVWGTVGGGKVENHCIEYAGTVLRGKEACHSRTWNLQTEIGMSCGGEVTFFFDVERGHQWNIAIFGAGHVSQALVRVLSGWACRLQVFDTRQEWVDRLPSQGNLVSKVSGDLASEVDALPVGTFILCMTQGHATDFPILDRAFQRAGDFGLVGGIGSTVKGDRLRRELKQAGHGAAEVDGLNCPLGLPIGNNTPSEIAVSIAAQLLGVRDGANFTVSQGRPELHAR